MKKPQNQQALAQSKTRPHERWPQKTDLPANESLTIVFHGLLSFCYTNDRYCEVGVFKAPNHNLTIEVEGGTCKKLIVTGDELKKNADIVLEVVGDSPQDVFSYQVGSEFNREDNENTKEKDFRWLLDLDGPDFYDDGKTPKLTGHYAPKLIVKSGIFYTYDKTASTFRRLKLGSSDARHLGNIAFCVAANIYLGPRQKAKLTMTMKDRKKKVCEFNPGTGQQIRFLNNCSDGGQPCENSDFDLHSISINSAIRFQLEPVKREKKPHPCAVVNRIPVSNDEAPCGATGYGGSSGRP